MNPSIKIGLLSLGLFALVGLTACQNTPSQNQAQHNKMMTGEHHRHTHPNDRRGLHHRDGASQHHYRGFDRHHDRRGAMTTEQRATFEKLRAERQTQRTAQRQAMQQACAGKIGQEITIKFGEKMITGTCQVNFRPTRSQPSTPVQPATPNTLPTTNALPQTSS